MDRLLPLLVTASLLIAMFFFGTHCFAANNGGIVIGTARDSATKLPIRFATIRTAGLSKGAMTNADGRYSLRLPAGSYSLTFSMVGYRTVQRTIVLRPDDTVRLDVALAETPFKASEIIVTAEEPATRFMRLAIERKMQLRDSLSSYSYVLYTKFTLGADTITVKRRDSRADTTLLGILETYSKGYYKRPDKYFNQIIQRRQTANFPPQANLIAVGTNLNAYDDEISLLGESIYSPFHPDALDFYSFAIEGESENEGRSIVRLRVIPKTTHRKLFDGIILLDKNSLTPAAVDLRPNKAVMLPFDAKLHFKQQFELIDGKFALPAGLSVDGSLKAEILFMVKPRIDFSIETVAYDYVCNIKIDENIFLQRRIEVSQSADIFDSTFWAERAIMPLRPEEAAAYIAIQEQKDNPDSLKANSLFGNPISREIAKLVKRPFSGINDIFRYNRVNGSYLGLGLIHSFDTLFDARGGFGYGTADKRWFGWSGATVYFDNLRRYSVELTAYRKLARRDINSPVDIGAITLLSLLYKNDYGDYYYADGYEIAAEIGFGQLRLIQLDVYLRPTSFKIFFRNETHAPAEVNTQYAFFGKGYDFRQNPAAVPGILRAFGGAFNWNFNTQNRIAGNGLRIETEIAVPSVVHTDFNFRQVQATAYFRTKTLPLWRLDGKFTVGLSEGFIPPQRFFSMESSASGLAAEGSMRGPGVKEFYGDRYAVLTAEHNFGEIEPGLFRIPNIAPLGLEFLLTGATGYSEFSQKTLDYTRTALNSTAATADKFYYEAGLSINRVLLFFRFDFTMRFSQRITPQFYFTLSAATF
ncbi:DUF5686 and carboxypeptidase-like regulatory domain-containing protein [Ignavibacteria bacterium]|nr:carboxypeptidase-like regulatory domain-containing protein [Bacteroidota bacterium]MCZ2133497.1 DUF5686 and carboxypeptidase regulatory-like domain-containing protein [Bacteroidota bacterium]